MRTVENAQGTGWDSERVTQSTVSILAGGLGVKVIKLRKGSFFPGLLEPHLRINGSWAGVFMTAYLSGHVGAECQCHHTSSGVRDGDVEVVSVTDLCGNRPRSRTRAWATR